MAKVISKATEKGSLVTADMSREQLEVVYRQGEESILLPENATENRCQRVDQITWLTVVSRVKKYQKNK